MFLKEALEAVDYRFSSGDRYLWTCYGPDSVYLNLKDVQDRPVGSILFDSNTAEVYEITVEVPGEPLCYRWIDPEFVDDHRDEAESRNVDPAIAWDDVKFTDIETEDDILDKLEAIVNCQEFDRSIVVPISMTADEELELHRQAHAAGMTTNDYINLALRKFVDAENKALDERYIR